ncbi:MAG: thiamine ABC transporter ATP-binding protein [Vibrio sp.]
MTHHSSKRAAIELSGVQYDYQDEIFSFDLQIENGSIMALMGASGSGKSTLLSLIAGFISPRSGSIKIEDENVVNKPPYQRPLAMLFQEHNLFTHLTVRQNIGLGLNPALKLNAEQQKQVEQAAQQVGLGALLDRLPEQLSGGQRQRVALARCFVQPHRIWLLDEPFSALDPLLRDEMLKLVAELARKRNITVLMVTHHLSGAKAIASDFAFLEQGKITEVGKMEELDTAHSNENLRSFLLVSG